MEENRLKNAWKMAKNGQKNDLKMPKYRGKKKTELRKNWKTGEKRKFPSLNLPFTFFDEFLENGRNLAVGGTTRAVPDKKICEPLKKNDCLFSLDDSYKPPAASRISSQPKMYPVSPAHSAIGNTETDHHHQQQLQHTQQQQTQTPTVYIPAAHKPNNPPGACLSEFRQLTV